jgi:chromosome segregation ATPase
MSYALTIRAAALAAGTAMVLPAAAQENDTENTGELTADEIRAEIGQAMETVAEYTAQERDAALAEARDALARLDAAIAEREAALRDTWAEMSTAAQEAAETRLRDLRQARNRLGERYGALQAGADDAWTALQSGFAEAWTSLAVAWQAVDEERPGG